MINYQDKVIIITGGGSGLGRAAADSIAAQGGKLVLVAPVTTWQAYNRYGGGSLYFAPGAPAGLNLFAAALHRYPYGGHVKFSMHLGPAVCLLARILLDEGDRVAVEDPGYEAAVQA